MRILTVEATEEPALSTQRPRCKILRNHVEDGAPASIFAVAALSLRYCCAAASASSARAPPSIRGIEWCPSWQAYSHMSSSSRRIGTS